MSFPRYAEYRDLAMEWVGEVPLHWSVVPLKSLISHIESGVSVNAVDTPAANGEPGVLKTSCVYAGVFDARENKAVVLEEHSRVACSVAAGTLIVSRMNTPDLVGAAGIVRDSYSNLFLPDRLWQIHFKGADPTYVYYWTRTSSYRVQVEMVCAGTSSSMQNLSQGDFRRFVLLAPPILEQGAIAAFLDHETAKIDALVSEQERLIDLLKEKRQAVISHAVTRGLNRDAPLKDSGAEWLGQVPAHWQVLPCRAIAFEKTTRNEDARCQDYLSLIANVGIIPYAEKGDVGNKAPEDLSKCKLVSAGDVVINSMNYGIGSFGLSNLNGVCSSVYIVLRPIHTVVETRFALRVFANATFQTYAQSFGNGILAHRAAISWDTLKGILVPVPPLDEQVSILTYLDELTSSFDVLTATAESGVALLRERRAALISAAVTGKIDLRARIEQLESAPA